MNFTAGSNLVFNIINTYYNQTINLADFIKFYRISLLYLDYDPLGLQRLTIEDLKKETDSTLKLILSDPEKKIFDELYDFLFVRPVKWIGRFLWKKGDGWLIDGFGPDGVSARVIDVTNRVVRLQTGYVYHYAFAMLIGVAALVTWMMFAR